MTPACGVSSAEKPSPVASRYLTPLMVKPAIETVPPGVVTIVGLAGFTVACSDVPPWSVAVMSFASPE